MAPSWGEQLASDHQRVAAVVCKDAFPMSLFMAVLIGLSMPGKVSAPSALAVLSSLRS